MATKPATKPVPKPTEQKQDDQQQLIASAPEALPAIEVTHPDTEAAAPEISPASPPEQPHVATVSDDSGLNMQQEQEISPPVPAAVPEPEPIIIEPLSDYIARVERAHLDRDVVAVEVTHPNANMDVYPGTYAGIRLTQGDVPSVKYSDGTTE